MLKHNLIILLISIPLSSWSLISNTKLQSEKLGKVDFQFNQANYISKFEDPYDVNQEQRIYLHFEGHEEWGRFTAAADYRLGFFSESIQFYNILPQAYVAFHLAPLSKTMSSKVVLGRKLQLWSELDSQWKNSFYQSTYKVDPLSPMEQALAGTSFEMTGADFGFVFLHSGLYIPNLVPSLKEVGDGQLQTRSRWYPSPRSEFNFSSKATRIFYELEIPELKKIIQKNSNAVQLRLGPVDAEGFYTRLSLADKPSNELLFQYKGAFYVTVPRMGGDVIVRPFSVREHLSSIDVGYNSRASGFIGSLGKQKLVVSALSSEVENESGLPGWNVLNLEDTRSVSLRAEQEFKLYGKKSFIGLGAMKLWGGRIFDLTANHVSQPAAVVPRFAFTDALSTEFAITWGKLFSGLLSSHTKWIYDAAQDGSWLNLDFNWIAKEHWVANLGADVLGVSNSSTEKELSLGRGFLSEFQANDRVYSGVTYVF